MKYFLTAKTTECGEKSFNFTTEQEYPVKVDAFGLDLIVDKCATPDKRAASCTEEEANIANPVIRAAYISW